MLISRSRSRFWTTVTSRDTLQLSVSFGLQFLLDLLTLLPDPIGNELFLVLCSNFLGFRLDLQQRTENIDLDR